MQMQSENINELITALAKAQGKIESAKKDKKNPFFKSTYADLASTWEACRQHLSEAGLAVVQSMEPGESGLMLVTTLAHSSGQWMRSYLPILNQKNDPQSLGSAITYMRRYSLAAIVGICPEDDDAEGAVNRSKKQVHVMSENISTKDYADLEEALGDDHDLRNNIARYVQSEHGCKITEMPKAVFPKILARVKNKKAQGE